MSEKQFVKLWAGSETDNFADDNKPSNSVEDMNYLKIGTL
jgi:hypothetical protein